MGKYLRASKNETALEKDVKKWINQKTKDGYKSWKNVLDDLFHSGCESGIVSELIWSSDCEEFAKKHLVQIIELIAEREKDTGSYFFSNETISCTLLAWIGFELAARKIANENGYEDD